MSSIYVDTSLLLLAAGGDHPDRERAIEFLDPRHGHELHTSVEGVQEFLFHRMRRVDRQRALRQAEAVMAGLVLHDFTHAVLLRSLDLVRHTSIRGRDAVHAATAVHVGIATLVTTDRDFHVVPGLSVVRP